MFESSAPWTFQAPDGSSFQANVGADLIVEDATGFDSPDIRQNIADLPEQDGAVAGNFFFGSRPVTHSGRVISTTAAQRNTVVAAMRAVLTQGLRGNLTVSSQPQGFPAMQVSARLQNFRVTGGYVKSFQIGLVCADPRMYSQLLHVVTATTAGSAAGAAFPWAFPVDWGGGTGGTASLNASNSGNAASPPVIRVTGPVQDPWIRNNTTGAVLYLDGVSLAAGEYVDIDIAARTVVTSAGANRYSAVRFPASTWWALQPGGNAIQLWAASSSSGVSLTVTYRDAWL